MATSNDTTKTCTKCGRELPATLEYFNQNNQQKDGLHPHCKGCRKAYREANSQHIYEQKKLWRESNPDKEKGRVSRWIEANREHYLNTKRKNYQNNKEEILAKQKEKRLEIPERFRASLRQRYQKNRHIIRASVSTKYATDSGFRQAVKDRVKRWKIDNPEKARALNSVRKQRVRKAPGSFTSEDVLLQYKVQKGLCWWCGLPLDDAYHIDHLIPVSRGGTNAPNNIVVTHPKCNMSKSDKMPWEWSDRLL